MARNLRAADDWSKAQLKECFASRFVFPSRGRFAQGVSPIESTSLNERHLLSAVAKDDGSWQVSLLGI